MTRIITLTVADWEKVIDYPDPFGDDTNETAVNLWGRVDSMCDGHAMTDPMAITLNDAETDIVDAVMSATGVSEPAPFVEGTSTADPVE